MIVMDIVWFNEQPKEGVVTLNAGSITLNKSATTYFENAYSVMLGTDPIKKYIVIKPLSKAEAVSNVIPQYKKYRISVHVSYSRITNKAFMNEVMEIAGLDLKNETYKFPATWNKTEQVLVVDLNGGV
jgi:hypothetical protein